MRILLVEDDRTIVDNLSELLALEGYAVSRAETQEGAVAAVERDRPDLVLLDVTLAQGNGFAVCTAVKEAHPDLPVIFLTASGDEINTVMGLSMGADDYVAKPFRPRELIARIEAALRRSQPAERAFELGDVRIDPQRARVTKRGAELALSAVEYKLLLLFAQNPGKLVTRDRIREALWEEAGTYIEENTLTVYIGRLRAKIEDDPQHPRLIITVRGLGYKAGR